MKQHKPTLLIILDGLGIGRDKIGSPWEIAERPTFSDLEKFYPFTALQASGIAVGLPWGKEGNSEVGHLAIGAGKIINNYLPKISISISDDSFFNNKSFLKAINHAKENKSNLHLIGLFSSGTVHAYSEHLYALLDMMKRNETKNVFLHLFTDGIDAYEKEGYNFFKKLEDRIQKEYPFAKIASVIGRKFAMDRENDWEKIEKAHNLFIGKSGNEFESASSYIAEQYSKSIMDESIEPAFAKSAATNETNETGIKNNDAVIFYNFREDSMREILLSFADENFDKFNMEKLNNLFIATMTEYDKSIQIPAAFESANVEHPLAKIISDSGLKQLHIAETGKYAHITYFLNGGKETPFEDEDRILIQSPKVESFDEAPEMSAEKISDAVISKLADYDFIAINFANADMVGHTGNLEATAKAIETIDLCLKKIIKKTLEMDGALVITADHGNAEEKIYKLTGEKKTKHSTNPVPLYLVAKELKKEIPADSEEIKKQYAEIKGTLTDIAPTVLELLGLKKSASMTGKSLVEKLTG